MGRSLVLATLLMSLAAAPAFANHCPKDAAAIDAYLSKAKVSDTLKAEVMALRDKGMALHDAGKHEEAEAVLAEAMRKLLMG